LRRRSTVVEFFERRCFFFFGLGVGHAVNQGLEDVFFDVARDQQLRQREKVMRAFNREQMKSKIECFK
jgi:hypothetical protein